MVNDQHETAQIEWRSEGTPVSTRFDDPYFSIVNGLQETRHVFLNGNRLPDRFCEGFHIAELGFGSGLNMLAAWHLWCQSGQTTPLRFTSFEAYPMATPDIRRALAEFPEITPLANAFLEQWSSGTTQIRLDRLLADIILGDARDRVPEMQDCADAWFLDGFSPAKNPELWSPDLMRAVASHTKPGGTFATYTAAGHIRRSLSEVGFVVDRVPGFGRKRHMTIGTLKDRA